MKFCSGNIILKTDDVILLCVLFIAGSFGVHLVRVFVFNLVLADLLTLC